jgi:hypothetical protein
MALQGKGMFIWQLPNCDKGDPAAIASRAVAAKLSHVLVKIADAEYAFNIDKNGNDLVPAVVSALHAKGIQVWGWHYVYGYNPVGEANIAVQRTLALRLDGYVIDAEGEFTLSGHAAAGKNYSQRLRSGLGSMPIALSSYRYPSLHMDFPWASFMPYVDLVMPQVYWEQAHNGDEQLARCVNEYNTLLSPVRPVFPTGPCYSHAGWAPKGPELTKFMQKALSLNLAGVNYFSWDYGILPSFAECWNAVQNFPWPPPATADIAERLVGTWNTHDSNRVIALYQDNAAHVTSARTITGAPAIGSWYNDLLNKYMPNGLFQITGYSGTGNSRHISWTATSDAGRILDGNDTLGLRDNKIQYQYTHYTIV